MERGRAAWRRWLHSPVRGVVFALVVTAVLVAGTYGEAHPSNPNDKIQFSAHVVPHPPLAAYLLVAIACLALAGRRRWPVAVLVVSTAAVAAFTLLGSVNGAALLPPPLALYALAPQVRLRPPVPLPPPTP